MRNLQALLMLLLIIYPSPVRSDEPVKGEMAGYLLVPNEKVPDSYDAGFSMYIAAWPLLKHYPGQRFQSGLPGTWMFAQSGSKPLEKMYSDIEGGLGWWRDTEYATVTPKFIMGGVAPNFVEWANGPGAGKGRNWAKPNGKYAVAQLSPWVLWPPDGLNLRQGVRGQWFGYGYLPLPLTRPKDKTNGQDVPTGNQCWTLFLNTGNFKGPVTFFTPYFWSRNAALDAKLSGHLLDSQPSNPNRALQMETQHIPSVQATDSQGVTYARIAPTQFPSNNGYHQDESALVHRITSYNKQALWNSVEAWFSGGPVASGAIHPDAAIVHEFPGRGGATWKIYPDNTKKKKRLPSTGMPLRHPSPSIKPPLVIVGIRSSCAAMIQRPVTWSFCRNTSSLAKTIKKNRFGHRCQRLMYPAKRAWPM